MTLDAYHFIPSYDTSHRIDHELDQFRSKSPSGGPNFVVQILWSKKVLKGVHVLDFIEKFNFGPPYFFSKRTKIAISNNSKVDQN